MKVYKLCSISNLGTRVSWAAFGRDVVEYEMGKYVTANEGRNPALFVFKNKKTAMRVLNAVHYGRLYLAAAKEATVKPKNANLIPPGTLYFKKVKLVRRIK